MRVSTLSSPDLAAGVVAVVMAGTAVAAARYAPADPALATPHLKLMRIWAGLEEEGIKNSI